MTSAGFDGATAFVESVLFKMTLGQAYAQQTRVGFITYSADANKRYDLTSFQSTDDMINNADLTYDGSRGTNIEAAIQLASTSFDSSAHRDNAQKVIVIVASDYQKGSYNDPTVAAETFKED
ncbi:von Willebrand factor type A domain protein, partial [Ancylostoma duodenale]